ncbi:ribosomal protein S18 acetylase RimI-like enzyme [Bacillus fengqiuensis]|nr:ribosomal protein S18 acetylase RimI-like enzyme [Bacillus fengqiuensis]
MGMVIENMSKEKSAEYIRLYASVFNEEPWNEHWTEQAALERLEDFMNTPKFSGFLLYDEGELVGAIVGHGRVVMDRLSFYVGDFFIKGNQQGKGYGKRLLRHLETDLKTKGFHRVTLLTMADSPAETFYEKQGYEVNNGRVIMGKSL